MHILRQIPLVVCAAALTAAPASAHAPSAPGDHPAPHGRSHRCAPHRVGYVAAGALSGQTLVLDGSAASGDVTIDVTSANRHARADKGRTTTYTLDHARVVLGLDDRNGDGGVDLADVLPGSRAKVVGTVTKLRGGCDRTGFAPTLSIAKLIVHAPRTAG
jgi:hypothetical protein